jgi:hypothetical protein
MLAQDTLLKYKRNLTTFVSRLQKLVNGYCVRHITPHSNSLTAKVSFYQEKGFFLILFVKKLKYTTDNGRRQRWVQTGNTPLHQN